MILKINPNTKIAIIGATGLVGRKMIEVLEERLQSDFRFEKGNLILVAGERSVARGKKVNHTQLSAGIPLVTLETALNLKPNIVLMSAGSAVSKEWAPKFAEAGSYVIDNSSAWRMDENIPLIVPHVSKWDFDTNQKIIANPNCVAIMLATGLHPFIERFEGIKKVSASIMQAVSGAGQKGIDAYNESKDKLHNYSFNPFVGEIHGNILPATTKRTGTDFNEEEWKAIEELPKILNYPSLVISPTNLRVSVIQGHSAIVRVHLEKDAEVEDVIKMFKYTENINYNAEWNGPLDVVGKDCAIVSNVRKDLNDPSIIEFFIVSDNLRMGAASNAVSIMEIVLKELSL